MCIAILNTKGTIPKETFKTCWQNNPDGGGFTYFNGKSVSIVKEMKDVNLLYKQYAQARKENPHVDFAIHFRIATHGAIDKNNCHPFKINSHSAFIHNGIISKMPTNKNFSDTHQFNELVLKKLPSNWMESKPIVELISGYIGYSKLVCINTNGALIINEQLGIWDGENWFSNTSYKPYLPPYLQANYQSNIGGIKWWEEELTGGHCMQEHEEFDSKNSYCECCDKGTTKSTYSNSYNIWMCKTCVKQFEPVN